MTQIKNVVITHEMKQSYLDYSMSVIVGRALPDVRDGLKPVHRRILYAMHRMRMDYTKSFKKCARIVGECFIKGTLVSTPKGLIPIEHLTIGNKVYTQNKIRKITQLYTLPKQPLIEVELENGLKNICTNGQMFKVFTKDLKYEWKKTKELTKEDYIVLRSPNYEIKKYIKIKELDIDEDIAYLLGLFLADGWISRDNKRGYHRIAICNDSIDALKNIQKILKNKFHIVENIAKHQNIHRIRINKNEINKKLISYFNLENKYAYNIKIPDSIFQSPKSVILSFISGLIDGDGSIHKNRNVLQLGSICESFIKEMQVLLFNQGILSTLITQKPRGNIFRGRTIKSNYNLYSLEITGHSLERISRLLNLYNKNKKQRLNFKRFISSKDEEIPYITKPIFEEFSKKHLGGGWYLDKNNKKIRLGIKYPDNTKIRYFQNLKDTFKLYSSNVEKLNILKKLNFIGSKQYSLLKGILENNLYFIKVKNIKESYEDVTYDIQVEDEHEFIANGVISHNCLGKYHPHGDVAVYDSLVRMAQDFSLRYPLIWGQGNFGSVDGDSPAHMRYTEAKLQKISNELLEDIEKETVDFVDNFDASLKEPVVLPAKLPNLLINGSSGIAVGMATNIPPHNLGEVCDAVVDLIDNPNINFNDLMKNIKGPDFPTGGIILGSSGIKSAYKTGRGKVVVRGKCDVENKRIVITEIPFMVNKSALIESIAKLVKEKKIEGISNIRDESDKEGMRIVIELKQNVNGDVVLNQLYAHTSLQSTFGVIMLALVDNQPRVLGLNSLLSEFIKHRKEVIIRGTKFDLDKAETRAHILEGIQIALGDIDNVISTIKRSKNVEDANKALISGFRLTPMQANAILEMRLQRLTSLEQEKIKKEHEELIELIVKLKEILGSEKKVFDIIKDEMLYLRQHYSDGRRTQILETEDNLIDDDLIQEGKVVITLSHKGYIKRLSADVYKEQRRGGKGVIATVAREEDFVENLFIAGTHDYILFFTNKGVVHWLKAYMLPEAGRYAKGTAIVNLLKLDENERVNSIIPVSEFSSNNYLVMTTKKGLVKKTNLEEYSRPRKGGIIGIHLKENDELVKVLMTDGKSELIIATKGGKALKFNEREIRAVGRNSSGVRGIKVRGSEVIGLEVCDEDTLLTVTENGCGKRTSLDEYREVGRGGSGVTNIKITEKNGHVVGIKVAGERDSIILITKKGILIRVNVGEISVFGRNTQGVRIMKLDEGDKLVGVAKVACDEINDGGDNNPEKNNSLSIDGIGVTEDL